MITQTQWNKHKKLFYIILHFNSFSLNQIFGIPETLEFCNFCKISETELAVYLFYYEYFRPNYPIFRLLRSRQNPTLHEKWGSGVHHKSQGLLKDEFAPVYCSNFTTPPPLPIVAKTIFFRIPDNIEKHYPLVHQLTNGRVVNFLRHFLSEFRVNGFFSDEY